MKPLLMARKLLRENGYILKRAGGGHDIYYNPDLRSTIPLKRHDFDEDDLRYISKEIQEARRPEK